MGAARKLQSEIDRVLKKVNEGLDDFDSIWEKVHDTENANQKEKYEADLKKEIKKLQRLRDQIKTWISSADIKDKSQLIDARKAIENEMERFKVCEKEAKTKAFSKAALGAAIKADPKETQREAARDWLSTTVENVNLKIEELEYEAAQLQENQGKKKGGKAMTRYHEIEQAMQKYQNHTVRLEQCLRCLDNDTVAPEEVMDLKDTLDLLVSPEEGCEAEESYDAVDDYYGDLLERLDVVDMHVPSVAAASHAKHAKHKDARTTRGAKGSAAAVAGGAGAGALEAVAEAEEEGGSGGAPASPVGSSGGGKDKERAAAAAVKAQLIAAGNTSVKLQEDEDRKQQQQQQQQPQQQRAPASANGAPPPSPQPAAAPQPRTSPAAPAGTAGVPNDAEDAGAPSLRNTPTPVAVPAAVAPPHSPVDDTRQPAAPTNGQLPSPSQQQPPQQPQQQQQQQQQQQPRPGAPAPQPAAGAPPRPGPPGAWNAVAAAGAKGPQQLQPQQPQQQQLPQQQKAGGLQPGLGTAPPGANHANHAGLHPDGPDAQQQQAGGPADGVASQLSALSVADRAASGPLPLHALGAVQPPAAAVAAGPGAAAPKGGVAEAVVQQQRPGELQLGQAPPSMVASHALIIMEGCTSRSMHQLSDTDYNSKRFKARHPVALPPSYPRAPPEILDNPGLFRKMDPEALFFAFYYQPDTYQQYLSAQELKRQSWRYHKTHNAWFQRYAEPSVTTEEYEQGTYVYFDYNIMHDDMQTGWCYRRKENFTFRYDALEDELQVQQATL